MRLIWIISKNKAGEECEISFTVGKWNETRVNYISSDLVVCKIDDLAGEIGYRVENVKFRPLFSPKAEAIEDLEMALGADFGVEPIYSKEAIRLIIEVIIAGKIRNVEFKG